MCVCVCVFFVEFGVRVWFCFLGGGRGGSKWISRRSKYKYMLSRCMATGVRACASVCVCAFFVCVADEGGGK